MGFVILGLSDTLSDKISSDKIFVGQNFSSDKIFVTDPNFRQFCPNICLQNSISSDKIFVGQNFSTDKIFVTDPQNSSVLSDEILSDKVYSVLELRSEDWRG